MQSARTLSVAALGAALLLATAPAAPAQVRDTTRMGQDTMRMEMADTMQMDTMQMDTMQMRQQRLQDTMQMRQGQMQDTMRMRQRQMPPTAGGAAGSRDIVAVASSNPNFSTLAQAIQAAGLESTLSTGGPYTVFAPTDAAFAKLSASTRQRLMNNPAELRMVLTNHVARGRLTAAEARQTSSVTTLQGSTVPVRTQGNALLVGNARVQTPDIQASNGIIHGIDTVLMPAEPVRKEY